MKNDRRSMPGGAADSAGNAGKGPSSLAEAGDLMGVALGCASR
jgi:hypothetical protein